MILNSFSFISFLVIFLIAYWKSPKRLQLLVLLLGSYFFYSSSSMAQLGLILISTIINYFLGIKINDNKNHKKILLSLALVFNLGALFAFKYLGFFLSSTNLDHAIIPLNLPKFDWILPLGISFYTLQVLGYMFDVYNEKIKAERKILPFAIFHCFFPQISAGPIEKANNLLPQIHLHHEFNYLQTTDGMKLFLFGMFKKMVIADNLGLVVDRVFSSLPEFKGLSLLITVLIYSWQIYMDFSGYTDMARGVAKILGFELMDNFNFPYFASSLQDFWRRWHISFSSWLREYVFFSLGGSRVGILRTMVNIVIVFMVSGLWHGAAWTFVIWGALHGVVMSIERLASKLFNGKISVPKFIPIIYSYLTVSILWIFFRSPSFSEAFYILKNSFVGMKNIFQPAYILASLNQLFVYNKIEMLITFSILFLAISSEFIRRKTTMSKILAKQPAIIRICLYAIMVFLIIEFRNSDIKEFIYTRF